MRQGIQLGLLVLFVVAGGSWATYMACPGCIDRARVNTACEWLGDMPFTLNQEDAAHQQHLVADAQLAEELAIRNADAEADKRTGVEHHGGLLDRGEFRAACLSRMFHEIQTSHAVSREDVQVARARRSVTLDSLVLLLFLPLYVVAAIWASGKLNRRFASDGRVMRMTATMLLSAVFTGLGLQVFPLWGAVWEGIRVGNGHMTSIRAATQTRWIHEYVAFVFVSGMILFYLVAWLNARLSREDQPGPSALGLLGSQRP